MYNLTTDALFTLYETLAQQKSQLIKKYDVKTNGKFLCTRSIVGSKAQNYFFKINQSFYSTMTGVLICSGMFLHTLTSAHAGAGVSPDALVASNLTRSTLVNANGHLRFVYSDQSGTARRGL